MILIFSERVDLSTKHVLRYLNLHNETFELFLEDDLIEFSYIIDNSNYDYTVFKNGLPICVEKDIKSIWYRRIDIRVKHIADGIFEQDHEHSYAVYHATVRTQQIQRNLNNKKCLGVFGTGNFNKIEFLRHCVLLNIDIPKTLISGSKKELIDFYNSCNQQIISKSIGLIYEYQFVEEGEVTKWKTGYTTLIDDEKLREIPNFFDQTIFQEKLNKKFEIRTFFINNKCFSQVILSQISEKSSLDYRLGYDTNMRCCNYTLPKNIEDQVCLLMNSLGLNTGSLDIVVTEDDRFVFLEVNPSGQFGAVSESTNSNIEYEIANFLMN